MKKYATTFDEIEKIFEKISDLDCERADDEPMDDYKKRVEGLMQPLISRLEGVHLEWIVQDFTDFEKEFGFRPENDGEEILHINSKDSPVRDIINSVLSLIAVKKETK